MEPAQTVRWHVVLISYAQHREDVILRRALRHIDRGTYIDVGAYLPVEYSTTKLFYDAGWSGINIEPCQRWFDQLVAARPRDVNLRIAASDQDGECEFYEVTDPGKGPHSTCIGEIASQLRQYGMSIDSYRVPMRRLAEICSEHSPAEVHFLKIDVEGAERQVLMGADFARFRPWIVVIEALDLQNVLVADSWEQILFDAGYRFGMAHAKNRFYWAAEHRELAAALSVPFDEYEAREAVDQRAVAQREILSLRRDAAGLLEQVAESGREAAGLRLQVSGWRTEAAALKEQVAGLTTEATELREQVAGLTKEATGLREQVAGLTAEATELRERVAGLTAEATGLTEQVAAQTAEATELRERVAGLTAEATGLREQVAGLTAEGTGLREQVAGQTKEAAELRERVVGLTTDAIELRARVCGLTTEAAGLGAQVTRLKDEVRAIRGSTSWRITAPLRALGAQLRHATRR